MGRIYNNLKRIYEKIEEENLCIGITPYDTLIEKFVTLVTYEDIHLMKLMNKHFFLKRSGNDMFIDCGGFGIIIDKEDNVSIHT